MSWPLLVGLVVALGLSLFATLLRRAELQRMARSVDKRERAVREGIHGAQLQHPVVDLSRCLGCATCVAVCPEDGVLELVHGQAAVVNGARCVGVSACERECPVGAITVTLANVAERDDIPAVTEELEAVGSPGLFLAGEVTAHALIKTAVEHGTAVAADVASRLEDAPERTRDVLDLCIVGSGPAGLACALEAKRHGLRFVTLEQESVLGGTVAKYPRRKLVVTEPVVMPLVGRLRRASYTKEELMGVWRQIVDKHKLPIRHDEVFVGLDRDDQGHYAVRTRAHTYSARYVCLALGRRGVPRKLGVPGEDLPKVAYSLLDAQSYQGRRILVVGGGDSAVEAALGLAEQAGNRVTLSYRKGSFLRIRTQNEQRLTAAVERGQLELLLRSQVSAIHPDAVHLQVQNAADPVAAHARAGATAGADALALPSGSPPDGRGEAVTLPNDEVFVMAGGMPPIELLQRAGVSFDSSLREAPPEVVEQGTGLVRALGAGFLLSVAALLFALWHADYYWLPIEERATHDKHALLRSGRGFGLWLGIASVALVLLNLLYLLRRSPRVRFHFGSLQLWMTSHVATGILALLCAMLHGAMMPRESPGGQAFWALVVLLVTGAIGRYFYACVPRAANGRELELAEVRERLGRISDEWEHGERRFREYARSRVTDLVESRQWRGSFVGRVLGLLGVRRDLRRVTTELQRVGQESGVADDQIEETLGLARRAHRMALMVAHYEDLRAVLNTWRYLHRWVAALMVLLVVVHIVHAVVYGSLFSERGAG